MALFVQSKTLLMKSTTNISRKVCKIILNLYINFYELHVIATVTVLKTRTLNLHFFFKKKGDLLMTQLNIGKI